MIHIDQININTTRIIVCMVFKIVLEDTFELFVLTDDIVTVKADTFIVVVVYIVHDYYSSYHKQP